MSHSSLGRARARACSESFAGKQDQGARRGGPLAGERRDRRYHLASYRRGLHDRGNPRAYALLRTAGKASGSGRRASGDARSPRRIHRRTPLSAARRYGSKRAKARTPPTQPARTSAQRATATSPERAADPAAILAQVERFIQDVLTDALLARDFAQRPAGARGLLTISVAACSRCRVECRGRGERSLAPRWQPARFASIPAHALLVERGARHSSGA